MFLDKVNRKNKEKPKKWPKIVWFGWLFLVFLIVSSIIRNVRKVIVIRSQIEEERQTVAKMEEENKKLQEKILTTQKIDFLEKEARNKLGLIKEGEMVVILPDEEILQKLAPQAPRKEEIDIDPNWKQWLKLFN